MTVGLGGAGLPAKSEGTSKAQSAGKAAATVATAVAKGIASGAEEATQQTQTQPTDKSNVDKKLKNDSVKPIDIFGDKPHPILCTMPPDPFIRKLDNHIDPAKLVENVR